MTKASYNGSNPSNSPVMTDLSQILSSNLTERVSPRPDRNTHNGQPAQLHPATETGTQLMERAIRTILDAVGEDPDREGLLKTPKRVAEAMQFLTQGYNQSLETLVNGAIFDEGHSEMVLV